MGTSGEITVDTRVGCDELCDLAVRRVELLEACWSRFRPTSELNRLNARAGSGPVHVSADVLALVEAMRSGWERTGGLFDPTVLPSVRAAGYDADFATVIAREALRAADPAGLEGQLLGPPAADPCVEAAPGMAGVIVDGSATAVTLPPDVQLDPGAIGKGLAGDIIVDELLRAGATGVLVNLGGDLSFGGRLGGDLAWVMAVQDERRAVDAADREDPAQRVIRWLEFDGSDERGAVATSTTLKRRWRQEPGGRMRHHVIDPSTGQVASCDLVQATVAAGTGWWAEVAATAALLLGPTRAPEWLDAQQLSYVLMTDDRVIDGSAGSARHAETDQELIGADRG